MFFKNSVYVCMYIYVHFLVQWLSHVWLFATLWTAACQTSVSFTISQSLLKLTPFESVMPSYHLILFHPLFFLPSVFPRIRVFSNELALCIRWPKIYVYVYVWIYFSVLNHSKICFVISLAHLPHPQSVDKSLLIARKRFSATEKIRYFY